MPHMLSEHDAPTRGARRPGRGPKGFALIALLLTVASCSSVVEDDFDLSPFARWESRTDSDIEEGEILGPLAPYESRGDGEVKEYGLRPFFYTTERPWRERGLDERQKSVSILAPFAKYHTNPRTTQFRFWPLFWWTEEQHVTGGKDFDWVFFPFLFYGSTEPSQLEKDKGLERDNEYFGFFPLVGQINNFILFDKFQFLLWPLMQRVSKKVYDENETFTTILLFFGWSDGAPRGGSWRAFPVGYHAVWEYPPYRAPAYPPGADPSKPLKRYDKRGWLWPFVHIHDLYLDRGIGQEAKLVSVWPFFKKQAAFDHEFWTILWPFFRYNREYPELRQRIRAVEREAASRGELPQAPETFHQLQERGEDPGIENVHIDFLSQVIYRYQKQQEVVEPPFEDYEGGFWRQRIGLVLFAEYHTLPLDRPVRVDSVSVLQPIGFFRRVIHDQNKVRGKRETQYAALVPVFFSEGVEWFDAQGVDTGRRDRFTKVWPLFSWEWNGDGSRNIQAFTLLPLRLEKYVKDFNDAWGFLWNLYEYRRAPDADGGYTRHAALFRLYGAYFSDAETSVRVPLLFNWRTFYKEGEPTTWSRRFLGGMFGWKREEERDGVEDSLVLFWFPVKI